jgi:hypothetical protein
MIRQGTPYLTQIEPDDDLSDMDLYEEARLATKEGFVIVSRPKVVVSVEPRTTDWKIKGRIVRARLANQQCWICGDAAHYANDCTIQRRIMIIGKDAEEIGQEAMRQQPYFDNKEAEVSD